MSAPAGKSRATSGNAAKRKTRLISEPESRLQQLIKLVLETAEAKGWSAYVQAEDRRNFRYATVAVSRHAGATHQEISGLFEIVCDKRMSVSAQHTSFHNWGLPELHAAIGNELRKLPWIEQKKEEGTSKHVAAVSLIERFLRRFHSIARQLKHRHNDRTSIEVADEYDVQDILHAVLRGLFDDVRAEEYTPSYAGGSARMDFLLKLEEIVLECKFTSPSLRDRQIGEQLLVDIGRYQSHPDCRNLICFVYDPSGYLKNPSGLEVDLSKPNGKIDVKVIVVSV
jgi:hypothetical protein